MLTSEDIVINHLYCVSAFTLQREAQLEPVDNETSKKKRERKARTWEKSTNTLCKKEMILFHDLIYSINFPLCATLDHI